MLNLEFFEEREERFMKLIDLQRQEILQKNQILNDMWDTVMLLRDCKRLIKEGKPIPEKWLSKQLERIENSVGERVKG